MKMSGYQNAFLAPLTYDRFFKKSFFDIDIAKAFLEAFFQRKIKNLKIKPEEKRISDFSKIVRFDYHCVFDDDTNVVIEMQQWYKPDIVKRFYLYHVVQASLQSEDLAQKLIFPQGLVQVLFFGAYWGSLFLKVQVPKDMHVEYQVWVSVF